MGRQIDRLRYISVTHTSQKEATGVPRRPMINAVSAEQKNQLLVLSVTFLSKTVS